MVLSSVIHRECASRRLPFDWLVSGSDDLKITSFYGKRIVSSHLRVLDTVLIHPHLTDKSCFPFYGIGRQYNLEQV